MANNQSQKNIPDGWQLTKLTDLGVFSKGAEISKKQLSESGHNAIRYGELYTRHNIKVNKIYSFISEKIIPLTKKIKYGDILFAGSGETIDEIGKSATYLLKEDCYAGGDVIVFSPKNANSLFLSYFLNFGEGRKKLRELGQGQSVVHIYKSDIEELELHLPSVPEQNRIVSVLETWDRAIESLNKKIEIKKQIKKGLMQDLLTGKKRLAGFKDKWETKKLGDLCDIGTGKKNNQDKIEDGKYPFFVRSPFIERINSYSYDGEAILIPGEGNIGKIFHYINGKFDFHQRVYKISDFKKGVSGKYIYFFIFKNFSRATKSDSVKATVDSLRLPTFTNFKVGIPTLREQEGIVDVLTTADEEIVVLERKLSVVKGQKTYLLNNLITGAIRTPENLSIKV